MGPVKHPETSGPTEMTGRRNSDFSGPFKRPYITPVPKDTKSLQGEEGMEISPLHARRGSQTDLWWDLMHG